MTTIGFVGLGNMGGPMAQNLCAAGYQVKVFDLVPGLVAGVDGAEGQASAYDTARDVDVFISMLPAGIVSRSLAFGAVNPCNQFGH